MKATGAPSPSRHVELVKQELAIAPDNIPLLTKAEVPRDDNIKLYFKFKQVLQHLEVLIEYRDLDGLSLEVNVPCPACKRFYLPSLGEPDCNACYYAAEFVRAIKADPDIDLNEEDLECSCCRCSVGGISLRKAANTSPVHLSVMCENMSVWVPRLLPIEGQTRDTAEYRQAIQTLRHFFLSWMAGCVLRMRALRKERNSV